MTMIGWSVVAILSGGVAMLVGSVLAAAEREKVGNFLTAVGFVAIGGGGGGVAVAYDHAQWSPVTLTVEAANNDGEVTVVRFREIPGRRFLLTTGSLSAGIPDVEPGDQVKAEKRMRGADAVYRFLDITGHGG